MLFFDYAFLFVFLPLFVAVYFLIPRGARNAWILVGSLAFYAGSSFDYVPILLFSIVVDYVAGGRIARTEGTAKKLWLTVSLATNLGLLGYFKYVGLFTRTLRDVGFEGVPLLAAALPVGISFFTFQSMSYSIDLYRGRVKPARSFIDFAAFVSMFPQLIAGPIVRFEQLESELTERTHSVDKVVQGIERFILGLAKKLLLADTAAALAAPIFAAEDPSLVEAWVSMFLYSVQIYFDFSGYTDMALGLGRVLGFDLPVNFDSPYRAASFSEFWHRWHITLSTWLRDNVYVPLGGNRYGTLRTYANLMIVMLLGGLWHGASWTFLIWGGLHGAFLAIERALGLRHSDRSVPRVFVVHLLTIIAWVPFRLDDLAQVKLWWGRMFGAGPLSASLPTETWLALPAFAAIVWLFPNTNQFAGRLGPRYAPVLGVLFIVSLIVTYGRGISPFIYFRF